MAKSVSRAVRGLSALVFGMSMVRAAMGSSESSELERRAVQSEATCLGEFNWMDNSLEQSPCIVAAYLLSACAGGNWDIEPVNASSHYTPPSATNANGCRCSWAVYNTLQACADCQGEDFESAMLSWSGYNGNCNATLLSDSEYYPADTPIPDETAIPFWATTNPSTWHDGLFDPSTAQSIANEDKSDVTQSSRSSNSSGKKTNVGAIAGGVVGGVLFLCALGLLAFFLARRRRSRRASAKPKTSRTNVRFSPLSHMRSASEMSAQQNYKYMAANGNGNYNFNNLTPSPGPTLPVSISMESTGGSGTRPPFHAMPSSNSFTSATVSPPPGEYVMHTQPGKAFPGAMPTMVAMNNPSNPTVSTAYATAAARSTHAPTLSSDSAVFSIGPGGPGMGMGMGGGEPPEGAIVPFVLPPTLPEPMGAEGIARSPTPGVSSKGGTGTGHGHGASDSTGSNELYTTAARKPERRNPPAYTFTSASPPPAPGGGDGDGDAQSAGAADGMSMEAQRAETTLSGTTLLQGSSAQAPTTLAGDAEGTRSERGAASSGQGRQRERDAHGYPVDRKA